MRYTTLTTATAETVVLRSRFIAYVFPIEGEEDASEKLAFLRKKHFDCTHVCYAYVADDRGIITKSSDDGEPSGTAGAPILAVIKGGDYKKVLVAVVRYFGGTKLGVGGLVKAYTDVANVAVRNAEQRTLTFCAVYEVCVTYSEQKTVAHVAQAEGGKVIGVEYGEGVKMRLAFESNYDVNRLISALDGKIKTNKIKEEYLEI